MPCRDYGDDDATTIMSLRKDVAKLKKGNEDLTKILTEAVCFLKKIEGQHNLCYYFDDGGVDFADYYFSNDLYKWYINYSSQEDDQIKQEALAKLTPREKKLLGLK